MQALQTAAKFRSSTDQLFGTVCKTQRCPFERPSEVTVLGRSSHKSLDAKQYTHTTAAFREWCEVSGSV